VTRQGKKAARTITRAHILRLSDEGFTDQAVSESVHVHVNTVERTRQWYVEGDLDFALYDRPMPGAKRKPDGKAEAFLVATACTDAPDGRVRWTMQLSCTNPLRLLKLDAF
jgi:transposase